MEKIYNWNPENLEFSGESDIDYCQITKEPILPAYSTSIKPIVNNEGEVNLWFGEDWESVKDHRGEIYWRKNDGSKVIIDTISIYNLDELTDKPSIKNSVWNGNDWEVPLEYVKLELESLRSSALKNTDWYVTRFIEQSVAIPEEVKIYRQELRDMTSNSDYPNIELPILILK